LPDAVGNQNSLRVHSFIVDAGGGGSSSIRHRLWFESVERPAVFDSPHGKRRNSRQVDSRGCLEARGVGDLGGAAMTDKEIVAIHSACRTRSRDEAVDAASQDLFTRAGDCITHLRKTMRDMRRRLVRQAFHLERAEFVNEQKGKAS